MSKQLNSPCKTCKILSKAIFATAGFTAGGVSGRCSSIFEVGIVA